MHLTKIIAGFTAACIAGMIAISAYAAGGDPVSVLQNAADSMIAGLKQNQATLKSKPGIVYSLAQQYVVPHANLDEMSRRVLPRGTWNSATPAQKAEFKKNFTRTLIRTYASALSNYKDQTVKFFPVRGGGKNIVTVESQIISSDRDPIHVSYQMMRTGAGWQLIDLSVEGVDMLASFRAQFADILSRGDMDQLLRRMSAHNASRG